MNIALARAAERGVHKGRFELTKGYCLRFCREADETIDGNKYDLLFRGTGRTQNERERNATATRAGHRFVAAGLGFLRKDLAKHGGLQAGDMLVKTDVAPNRWGDFSGHIGTLCEDLKRLAENSSTRIGRVRGALGFRTLEQFGDYDIVIRIPDSSAAKIKVATVAVAEADSLMIVTRNVGAIRLITDEQNGKSRAVVRETLAAAGLRIVKEGEWGDGTHTLYVELLPLKARTTKVLSSD